MQYAVSDRYLKWQIIIEKSSYNQIYFHIYTEIKNMSKNNDATTLKKLMKIIYDKQKQIQKYKKQLRQKEREKDREKQKMAQKNICELKQSSKMGLTSEQKLEITREIIENKRFLQCASAKLSTMQYKIKQLQTDLSEQQNRNQYLEEQIYQIKLQSEDKDKVINQLTTIKSLLENSKIINNGELSEKQRQIQSLVIQMQKTKIISEQINNQNIGLRDKLRTIQNQVNKQLKFIHKNLRHYHSSIRSQAQINFNSRVAQVSDQSIKTHTFILDKLQQTFEQKLRETMELFKKWEETLIKREEQWRKNFDRGLSDHSFGGISQLIGQSMMIKDQNIALNEEKKFYDTSMYKRNQQQLLRQLQRQCQKSQIGPISMQKQKQVQLSQVKESLKMTKQVNQQLFDELNKKENILNIFKETFKSLEQKKLLKNEGNLYVQKLRTVLGPVN